MNQNKVLIKNTLLLYIRLFITSISGIVSTSYILNALGASDYGLFNLIAGLIVMIGIANTIMLSVSNRFIAIEIGKNDLKGIKQIFNASLIIHIIIALITLIISFGINEWVITHLLNINDDRINVATKVLNITIVGASISMIGTPYVGLLLAKEEMFIIAVIDIASSLIKIIISVYLIHLFEDKLLFYTTSMSIIVSGATLITVILCYKKYYEEIRYEKNMEPYVFKQILLYSIWIGYGAIATIAKTQGIAIIINKYFGTILNASLGIAYSVNSILIIFATNIGKAISPQITKSYGAGNHYRMENLVISLTKYTFFLLLIPSVIILLEMKYILKLWLINVPIYTDVFIRLLIIDSLIGSLNAGIPEAIQATGKIKWYQIIVNTVFLLSIPISYIGLEKGLNVEFVLYTNIAISIAVFFIRQILLNQILKFTSQLYKLSYFPIIIVVISISPLFIICHYINMLKYGSVILIPISFVYMIYVIYKYGMHSYEKEIMKELISIIKRKLVSYSYR